MALISLLGEGRALCGTLCSPWDPLASFPCWKFAGLRGAAAAFWGMLPSSRDALGSQKLCVRMCLPQRGAGFAHGGAAGPAGSLSGTCFFLWLLRLSGVGGSDPLPMAPPPSRE